MKFTTDIKLIKNKIPLIKRGFNPNHTLPALTGILLKTINKDQIEISSTDLYFGVKFKLKAKIEEGGEVIVQGQSFLEFVNSLKDGMVDFSYKKDQTNLNLKNKNIKIKLPVLINVEFPEFPQVEAEEALISLENIKYINSYIASYASYDKTRPILTGIFLSFKQDNLTVAATDGYRLAVVDLKNSSRINSEVIVPAKVMTDLEKTMIEQDMDSLILNLDIKQYQAKCVIGDVAIYIRLIEGEYPPYKKIIPDNFNLNIPINSDQILIYLKQARIFSRNNSNIVQLRFKKDGLEVYANSGNTGEYSGVLNDAKLEKDIIIAFNIDYLIDLFQKAENKNINMHIVESLKPVMFKIEGFKNLKYIIMPIKVHN